MIKFGMKGGDIPVPQISEYGLELPPFFCSPTKKGWKLLNPMTTIRNLAKRKHQLSIDLSRSNVKRPMVTKDGDARPSPEFKDFSAKDQEKLREWEASVNAKPEGEKSGTHQYAHGPVKERGRPVYLAKNGEHHGMEFNEDADEYGINPKAPPKPKKARGRPKGPPKPPPPPKRPRGRPRKAKKARAPPQAVAQDDLFANLVDSDEEEEPEEEDVAKEVRDNYLKMTRDLKGGKTVKAQRKEIKKYLEDTAEVYSDLGLIAERNELKRAYKKALESGGSGLIGRGPKKATAKKSGSASSSSEGSVSSSEEEDVSSSESETEKPKETAAQKKARIAEATKRMREKMAAPRVSTKKAKASPKKEPTYTNWSEKERYQPHLPVKTASSAEEARRLNDKWLKDNPPHLGEDEDDYFVRTIDNAWSSPDKKYTKLAKPKTTMKLFGFENYPLFEPTNPKDLADTIAIEKRSPTKGPIKTDRVQVTEWLKQLRKLQTKNEQEQAFNSIAQAMNDFSDDKKDAIMKDRILNQLYFELQEMDLLPTELPNMPDISDLDSSSHGASGSSSEEYSDGSSSEGSEESSSEDEMRKGGMKVKVKHFDTVPSYWKDENLIIEQRPTKKGNYRVYQMPSRETFGDWDKETQTFANITGNDKQERKERNQKVTAWENHRDAMKRATERERNATELPRRQAEYKASQQRMGGSDSEGEYDPTPENSESEEEEKPITKKEAEKAIPKKEPNVRAWTTYEPTKHLKLLIMIKPNEEGFHDIYTRNQTPVGEFNMKTNEWESVEDFEDIDFFDPDYKILKEIQKMTGHGLIRGGALSADELKKLLGASYDAKTTKVNDFHLDPSVSSKTSKVYHNDKTGQTVVAHMGTQGITDWGNNAVYALGGKYAYKKTDRYKEAKKVQDAAEKKYGAKNISTIGHSQGGLQAELLGKNSKETITVNKATVPFQNKTNANQTDVRTKGDVVSALNPFAKKNNKEVEIGSSSYNPLTNHSADTLGNLDPTQMIGETSEAPHKNWYDKLLGTGLPDWEHLNWGSFTEQFKAFKHQHPDIDVDTLEDFADKILQDPEHYRDNTIKRARFYMNVILKKKSPHTYIMSHGYGIDPRLVSPMPQHFRHPNAMANIYHSPVTPDFVRPIHGHGLYGMGMGPIGQHGLKPVGPFMGHGFNPNTPIGKHGMRPTGDWASQHTRPMGLGMPIGQHSMKPRGGGMFKKGSQEAKDYMASIRKKKMKGGAIPPPRSRSAVTDPTLL